MLSCVCEFRAHVFVFMSLGHIQYVTYLFKAHTQIHTHTNTYITPTYACSWNCKRKTRNAPVGTKSLDEEQINDKTTPIIHCMSRPQSKYLKEKLLLTLLILQLWGKSSEGDRDRGFAQLKLHHILTILYRSQCCQDAVVHEAYDLLWPIQDWFRKFQRTSQVAAIILSLWTWLGY